MKKLSIFSMLIAAFLVASCDRNIPGGETPVGDATLSVKVAGTQATRALSGGEATANAVTINDLTVFVFNTDGNLVAMGQASSEDKVVDLHLFSGITYNIFVIGNKKDLDLSGITSQSQLLDLYTADLDDQEDINGTTLSPTVTGYFMDATMSPGKNYLGYDSGVTGTKLDGDNLFYVHRLISRVYLSSIENNNPDLTITAINILNAKSKSMLFPSTPAGNNTSTNPDDKYYKIAFPEAAETTIENFTHVDPYGYYWNYTSFAHGTLANTDGGTRFPRLYKDNTGNDITATAAAASLKTLSGTGVSATTDPLRYEVSGSPVGGNDISDVAFYLFANDNNPGDHATILLIEGTVEANTVYYPIVINAAGHGTIDAGTTGEENTYIKRNRQYEITATIADGSDGYANPWLDVTATLDVQVTISDWVATITQDVTF
ncbi:MAG: fimbrial protein [Bacteroidales bacterium]|nr:fimbrial protein [Bacteroidales bacterium]